MSDIPVGTPPVPPGRHAAPSGWYADPVDAARERYWDGWQWSRDTREVAAAAPSTQQHAYAPYPQPSSRAPLDQPQYGQPYGQQQYGQQPYGQQPYGQSLAPVPTTPDGVRLAGWWHRALAVIIDGIILNIVTTVVSFPLWQSMIGVISQYYRDVLAAAQAGRAQPPQPELLDPATMGLMGVIAVAIQFAYLMIMWRSRGASIGKLAVGLRVVPVGEGRFAGRLGWGPLAVRALIWVLPALWVVFMAIRVVDVLWPLRNPRRQALHDVAARTQVVRVR